MGEAHIVSLFHQKPVLFERGQGAHLFTAAGERYTDLGGASHGVANFGYSHPKIVEAIRTQAQRVVHLVQSVPTPARAEFLDELHRLAPARLDRTYLANSGAEAVEAALKFAHTTTKRSRFVALKGSFHGRTLGALATTFRPAYRKPFEALLRPIEFVPANDEAALKAAITPETAAVLVEPLQGEGGVNPLTDEFLRAAERIAHSQGALLIVDEIQTGLGRTGKNLAIDGTGVQPDLLLLGKSLAGGLPIGAAVMREEVAASMPMGGHGSTFSGGPLVCAAGTVALRILRDEKLADRARSLGERFRARLSGVRSPLVRELRGRGLMQGLEFRVRSQYVLDRLLSKRFLALPAGSNVIRFLPPLVIDGAELDAAADAVAAALQEPAPLQTTEAPA